MTVQETFEKAMSLVLETADENSDKVPHIVNIFNLMLAELFVHNNIARDRKGKKRFTAVPVIEDANAENPYEEELHSAMVYGLGAKLFTADENELAGTYNQQYYALVASALMPKEERVVDVIETDCY